MRRFAAPAFVALALSSVVPACGARADLDPALYGGDEQTGSGNGSGASGAGAGSSGAGATGAGAGSSGAGGQPSGSSGSNTTGPGSASGGTSGVGGSGPGSGPGSSGQGGAPSGSSGVGGGPTCPSFDGCTDCIAQQCKQIWCNCSNDPDCFGLFQCAQDCQGDEGCAQMCYSAYEDGIADALLVSDCAAQPCSGVCDWGDELDPCTKCILEDCEDEMNACVAEPECLILYQCLSECPALDLMCQQACYADHGAGVATLQPVLMCSAQECADPGPCGD